MSHLFTGRQTIEVPCTIEIEQTQESLHAHVDLQGIDIGPGDEVVVHAVPYEIAFGEKLFCQSHATVVKVGPIERLLTRMSGYLELTELYEVGFSAGRTP